jgi:hypothetical protein
MSRRGFARRDYFSKEMRRKRITVREKTEDG